MREAFWRLKRDSTPNICIHFPPLFSLLLMWSTACVTDPGLYIALLDRGIRIYVLHGIGDIGIDRKESIHSSTHSGEILIPVDDTERHQKLAPPLLMVAADSASQEHAGWYGGRSDGDQQRRSRGERTLERELLHQKINFSFTAEKLMDKQSWYD